MNKIIYISLFLFTLSSIAFSQSIDDYFSPEKMKEDLEIFKNIRLAANSGLYKYRTKQQIDSIYQWAEEEIENSNTYLDFFNIINQLTDFEGSAHNTTTLPKKYKENLKQEKDGYFPYPIKWIDGKWIINYKNDSLPLGSQIITINNVPIEEIIVELNRYYTTDGLNTTGKRVGLRTHFSRMYRFRYGQKEKFEVTYKRYESESIENRSVESVGYKQYYKNFNQRYSKPYDQIYYEDLKDDQKYKYEQINSSTGRLTILTFSMGNEKTEEHKTYLAFLDSVFYKIKTENVQNLIVDVRYNGGGTDPNDLVTYSFLTQREFQENIEAWIGFKKIPYLKYIYTKFPRFVRPIGVIGYNRSFRREFPEEKDGKYFQDATSDDHKIRKPSKNAFTGNIYLLVNPEVASAASLFAAMAAGNDNTTVIGEETMGAYYGHNGHTPLGYILPQSKIETFFSVVNLEQDVPKKSNQKYNRGIIPDYDVSQSVDDYLNQEDTQMNFVLDLIKNKAVN